MRLLLLLATLLTTTTALAGDLMPRTLQNVVESDKWALAEGTHEDKPLLIRYRDGLRDKPDLSGFPELVRVVWAYPPVANGMPGSDSSDQMHAFEDRLVAAVELSQTAVLAAVITNDGQREWLFYAADVPEFGRRLTAMPQEAERYPIELSAESDPEWSAFYDGILAGLSE